MIVDEALFALDELFDSPERWTKGTQARNAEGRPVSPNDPTAASWCLMGGIRKVVPASWGPRVLAELRERIGATPVVAFNDHPATTFARVKAILHDRGE